MVAVDPTPVASFALTTELAGGSYARQRLIMGAPSAKQIANTGSATFSNLVLATVNYFGFWTALAGGEILATYQLSPALAVTASSQVLVAAADITLALN